MGDDVDERERARAGIAAYGHDRAEDTAAARLHTRKRYRGEAVGTRARIILDKTLR